MRIVGSMVLALGLTLALSAPAMAQRGGGMMGGGAMLLGNPSVQQELKMTEEQISKATAILEEVRGKYAEQMRELFQQGPEGREKVQALSREMTSEIKKAAKELMKPEQLKRFGEIELQQAGASALENPEVVEKLKVTDDQKSKIQELVASSNQEMRTIMQSAFQGGDRQEAMKKVAELRESTKKKALEVLTADQQKSFTEMLGAPFEIKFQPRGGGQ